jgi:hypothetical protein
MTPAAYPWCSDRVLAWRAIISRCTAERHKRSVCPGLPRGNKAGKPGWCYLCPTTDPLMPRSRAIKLYRWNINVATVLPGGISTSLIS